MSALPDRVDQSGADSAPPETPVEALASRPDLQPVPNSSVNPTEDSPAAGGFIARARGALTPPAIWSERQPSPAEELDRARRGTHLPPAGALRTAAIVDGTIAAGVQAVLAALSWAVRHPARRIVVALLVLLLLLSPAGEIVAWVLFGIPHLLFELFA